MYHSLSVDQVEGLVFCFLPFSSYMKVLSGGNPIVWYYVGCGDILFL